MPEVNGKKYPYTAKGKAAAKKAEDKKSDRYATGLTEDDMGKAASKFFGKKAEDKQGSAAWRRDQLLEARDLSMEAKGKADGVRYSMPRGSESRNARTAMQRDKARNAKKAALKASLKK